jgi:hypothetical protein
MRVSTAIERIGQVARKVEGLVVRLDRGSSNLPGRIFETRLAASERLLGNGMERKEFVPTPVLGSRHHRERVAMRLATRLLHRHR